MERRLLLVVDVDRRAPADDSFVGHVWYNLPMKQASPDDQYPPDEAQRRFEALIRAARRPPVHREDVPRTRGVSKPKAGVGGDSTPAKKARRPLRRIDDG